MSAEQNVRDLFNSTFTNALDQAVLLLKAQGQAIGLNKQTAAMLMQQELEKAYRRKALELIGQSFDPD